MRFYVFFLRFSANALHSVTVATKSQSKNCEIASKSPVIYTRDISMHLRSLQDIAAGIRSISNYLDGLKKTLDNSQ